MTVICGRHHQRNGPFKDVTDFSTRLASKRVKYLFSVVELLIILRNKDEHLRDADGDTGKFVRENYPFLLSHVWHVRLENCRHIVACLSKMP